MYHKIGQNGNDVTELDLIGNCCIKIFQKYYFSGRRQTLYPGMNQKVEIENIRAMKFGQDCR